VPIGLAGSQAFTGQPQGFVPCAGHDAIEAEQGQCVDRREDAAAVQRVASQLAKGFAATGQPVGAGRRGAQDQGAAMICLMGQAGDGSIQLAESSWCDASRVGLSPGQQFQLSGDARSETGHNGVEVLPQFRLPAARTRHEQQLERGE
jgi:hypothetical protein